MCKACIPLDIAFALGTQHNQKQDKQHEIYMPKANPALVYQTRTIFHWPALGVGIGGNANLCICVGGIANVSVFRFQQCKIVVMGVEANTRTQCEWFCVTAEYRLKVIPDQFLFPSVMGGGGHQIHPLWSKDREEVTLFQVCYNPGNYRKLFVYRGCQDSRNKTIPFYGPVYPYKGGQDLQGLREELRPHAHTAHVISGQSGGCTAHCRLVQSM